MSRNFYLGVGAAAALVLSMACTTKDDTGEGGGGSTSTSGTGGTTSGTGGGGGTTSGTGGGGGGDCATCLEMLTDPMVEYDDMCTASAPLWDDLSLCICGDGTTSGNCETDCAEECGGGTGGGGGAGGAGGAGMGCEACTSTQCATELNACSSDM